MIEDPAAAAAVNLLISLIFALLTAQRFRDDKIAMGAIYLFVYGWAFAMFVVRLKQALA